MEAPTTREQINSAYKELYRATANTLEAQRKVNAARAALKEAEAVLTTSDAVAAGKNAEARAAMLYSLTAVERLELRNAEDTLAFEEREQALAKIVVSELRDLLRLAEWQVVMTYDVAPKITHQD